MRVRNAMSLVAFCTLFLSPLMARHAKASLPQAVSPMGAVVQSWHRDAASQTVSILIANNSHKDITAYSLTVHAQYVDGTSDNFQAIEDMLFLMINTKSAPFAPGATKNYSFPTTKDVADVKALVDVVVYSDRTADVQNEQAFKNLVALRKGNLLSIQKADDVINQVLSDPSVKNPASVAAAQLSNLLSVLDAKSFAPDDPEAYEKSGLKSVEAELRNRGQSPGTINLPERDYLKTIIERHAAEATEITTHSRLMPS